MEKIKTSRSERRYQNALAKTHKEHERKLDDGKLSLPKKLGRLSIIVSNMPDHRGEATAADQIRAFHNEADELAEHYSGVYNAVKIHRKATAMEMGFELSNPEVAGLITIGHGNIGDFWLEGGEHIGWDKVAKLTKYLKQGEFVQRMCGNFPFASSVPLGTFAVSDQRNVIAPTGEVIDDLKPDESLFGPVYGKDRNDINDITDLIAEHYVPF
jgi:hypothetical protein